MDTLALVGLELYADMFSARQDAYVRDSRAHVNEPLTPDVIRDAITTKHAVSGYMARTTDDGRVLTHVGAIDFDKTPDKAVEEVRDTMTKIGLPSLLSRSRRGAHLWVISHSGDGEHGSEKFGQIPASSMRKALEHAVRLTNTDYLAGVEVFPKQSTSPWGVGALRLPLMTHPKTGLRYPCFDMKGNRLTKLIDVVSSIEYADWSVIHRLAMEAPVVYPRSLGEYRRQSPHAPQGNSASELLATLGVQVHPGHSCRCPFHEDSHASMSVAADDERAWCKAPECSAYNGGRGLGTMGLARLIASQKAGK